MTYELCPKCNTKNLGENNFCECCLYNFVVIAPQEFYSRWYRVVVKI